MNIEIITKHLVIRPYQTTDFENSVQLYGNAKVMKYFDYGQPLSRESVKTLIEKGCALFKKGNPCGLFSILHQETGEFPGWDQRPAAPPSNPASYAPWLKAEWPLRLFL